MFEGLLVHPKTASRLELMLKSPPQAILLVGPQGSGKLALANKLAAGLLGIKNVEDYPHFIHVRRPKDKQNITIDSIRSVSKALRLQIPGSSGIKRVILIEDAHFMNQEAQNALLKSLEEPSTGTKFILTCESKTKLLPTISSRTAATIIHPVGLADAVAHYKDHSQPEIEVAWNLSQGAPGLLAALLGEQGNELREAVDKAKNWLKKNRYERFVELDSLKSKEELGTLLEGLGRILKALYRASAGKGDKRRVNAYLNAAELVLEAKKDLDANVLQRLVVLKLATGLNV